MAEVADDDPPTLAELASFQRDARAWVAVNDADTPAGYLLLDVVDGNAHVEQVSVHPDFAGRRLGEALLDTAGGWARHSGLPAMTLTTFAEVPWNAPYYRRLGFEVLAEHELGSGLRRIPDDEAARGLNRWRRVLMRRSSSIPSVSSGAIHGNGRSGDAGGKR